MEEVLDTSFLPLLPVKDTVIFPNMMLPLFVGRAASILSVEKALQGNRYLFIATQRDGSIEAPTQEELYTVGTVVQIIRMLKQPDETLKLLVQGVHRATLRNVIHDADGVALAHCERLDSVISVDSLTLEAQIRGVKEQLLKLVSMGRPVLPDFMEMLESLNDAEKLTDILSANMGLSTVEAQGLLEITDLSKRLEKVAEYFNRELSILEVQQKIASNTKGEMDKVQREYFLREQLKAIQKELGMDGGTGSEIEELDGQISKAKMPKEVEKEAKKQLHRLANMQAESAEATVIRTYLDWLIELPWSKSTKESLDLKKARAILDEDHYGMDDVKERILDFLAVRKLKPDIKSPILCLVGPPGVGKTSLGKSVARALNRKFERLSVGGVHDEAEIRGHRRTYIGAMPGKIIQSLKSAKSKNPVIMLDEIDKLGSDPRGNPSSALLEVLDPMQNHTFTDHYIGVPFDLSDVFFITTANYLDPIPEALKDRMEIISLVGYTEEEKIKIAERYIIPRQLDDNGLEGYGIKFTVAAIKEIINGYTRESGLRRLEQLVGKVCRKIARIVVEEKPDEGAIKKSVTLKDVKKYLGARVIPAEDELKKDDVGVVTGLAWTPVGGEVLFVECTKFAGSGGLIDTGMMGDVMKESIRAALTYVRSIGSKYGLTEENFTKSDLHIHVPAGAIPKDGPSAGVTMATAIMSAMTGRTVKRDVAMTGEITITGKVLPIGGLKEKLFAAKRLGIKTVIIPKKNEIELEKMPKSITESLNIIAVSQFDEVLSVALNI